MKLIITLFIVSQLVACSKVHDLTPIYDKNAKTLTVDNLSIKPVSYYKEKKGYFGDIHGGGKFIKYFKINDKICRNLKVHQYVPDPNVYFEYSASDEIMIDNNDSCLTKKIGNIQSLRCMNKIRGKINLYLTSSEYIHEGYGRQTIYAFSSNQCLKKFESYFVGKTQPKNVGNYKSNKLKSSQEIFLKSLVE